MAISPSPRVRITARVAPELTSKIDQFAASYGYTRSTAMVTLLLLGLAEQERREEKEDETISKLVEKYT